MTDNLYPVGYTTEWVFHAEVQVGFACLIIDGIAVLEPVYAVRQQRAVVDSDYFDLWGQRQTRFHYEYRTL